MAKLVVLLGNDFAGKSSLLSGLASALSGWSIVSYDDQFVPQRFAFVRKLKSDLMRTILPGHYSVDMLLGWLHVTQLYLRDATAEALKRGPVVVDSYSYKFIAKCQLRGLGQHPIVQLWREFPKPDEVICLDVAAEQLAERVPDLGLLNPFEHYGETPTRESFLRFQSDLQQEIARTIIGVPTKHIDGHAAPEAILNQVQTYLST